MHPILRKQLEDVAEPLGMTAEELCVRYAKKLKLDRRTIVRSRKGQLRIVEPGEKLNLKKDEFIANVEGGLVATVLAEIEKRGNEVSSDDLGD